MMSTNVKIVSDGVIKFDGGSMFGPVPKPDWEQIIEPDRKNRITLGLNCLLIQVGDRNILVDTGLGFKNPKADKDIRGRLLASQLFNNIRAAGIEPKNIHGVVLTHLHFDHSGGCTRIDRGSNLVPTFPNAKYYVQETCWEEACEPDEFYLNNHRAADFKPIQEHGQLELLRGDSEIVPGVNVIVTNGHTKGHQIVMVNRGHDRVVYLGDIIPTPYHLNLPVISAFDRSSEDSLSQKRELLAQAYKDGWKLVFAHGLDHNRAGYLVQRGSTMYLEPVDL